MSIVQKDTSGNLWQLVLSPEGVSQWVPVAAGTTADTGDEFQTTLQDVVNLCRTHVELMPIADVGGFSNEPALSLANDALQELCAQPYAWKFNSRESALLVTSPNRQTCQFAGASAFTKAGGVGISLASLNAITQSGSTVTVNTLQPHGFTVGDTVYHTGVLLDTYNSTFEQSGWTNGWVITSTPTPTSYTFEHTVTGLGTSGAPGISDFGWLESATLVDTNDTSPLPRQWPCSAVRTIQPTSAPGRPEKVAVLSQSNGVLTVRFQYVPNGPWGVTLVYQKKPAAKIALTDNWSPFPDEYGFVYRQMFLARCYRFLDHKRADAEEARALGMITKAMGRNDAEDSDAHVSPEISIMGGYGW